MNKIFLVLLFASLSFHLVAQDKKSKISSSVKRVDSEALITEAEALIQKNPSQALDKLELALSASIADKDVINEARCYLLIAEINENISEWKLATNYYEKARQIFEQQKGFQEELMKSLTGLGEAYLHLRRYDKALQSFQSLLNLNEKTGTETMALLKISEVYFQQDDYENALRYAERAEKPSLRKKIGSTSPEIQNQKAKIYARMNELEKAQEAYHQGYLQESQDREDDDVITAYPANKAKAEEEITKNLRSQNRIEEEINFRTQNIQQRINTNNLSDLSKEKVELGELLIETGKQTRAITELREAVVIADSIGDYSDRAEAYLSLAEAYRTYGNTQHAMEFYDKYADVSSLLLQEKDSQLTSRSEIIRKQKIIEEQARDFTIGEQTYQLRETKLSLEQSMIDRQQLIIYGLCFILLIIVVTSYFIYKNAQASKLANQLLALKSLRSQMNPHFIFNALNSVNQFISQNDERAANKFLADFSKLMRMVLDHSHEDFITLSQEKEIITLYLKLEQYRFREKFDYSFSIDEDIELDSVHIPPMLIQPYIENAVWHGLRYKEEFGHLSIDFIMQNSRLVATIEDDGIGRKNSHKLKTENQKLHNSKGLKNIEQRLKILNKVYKTHYRIEIADKDATTGEGTRVTILIPFNNHG